MFRNHGFYYVTDDEVKARVEEFEKLPEWKQKKMRICNYHTKTYIKADGKKEVKTFKTTEMPNRHERRSSWARLPKETKAEVIKQFNEERKASLMQTINEIKARKTPEVNSDGIVMGNASGGGAPVLIKKAIEPEAVSMVLG